MCNERPHTHRLKSHSPYRFISLLAVLVGYFMYLSMKFDFATGGMVSALTWSFFVLCTPVADAGFLLDFPIRLLFGLKMFVTELMVWILAIIINLVMLAANPAIYDTTALTAIFKRILVTPYPYWGIIVLCGIGTFLSVYFGDEVMDKITHRGEVVPHHMHVGLAFVIMGGGLLAGVGGHFRFSPTQT